MTNRAAFQAVFSSRHSEPVLEIGVGLRGAEVETLRSLLRRSQKIYLGVCDFLRLDCEVKLGKADLFEKGKRIGSGIMYARIGKRTGLYITYNPGDGIHWPYPQTLTEWKPHIPRGGG
jgi:hypothetical protein